MGKMRPDKRYCLERDKVCRICGEKRVKELTLHHIYPKGHKDRDQLWAKTILCKLCHLRINSFWGQS